jgi:hypothetical protein
MDEQIFINISKIIERDSKSSTYKFALLRGTIDIITENSPFIEIDKDKVTLPLGLLVEKWLLYYYPIFEASISIPQIHGNTQLAFERQFRETLISHYYKNGGYSAFYNDLRNREVDPSIKNEFISLVRKIRDTIVKMPMKYIGRSISENYYSIYNYRLTRANLTGKPLNTSTLINKLGVFTIPKNYYEAFKIIGSFISGTNSIIFNWAKFSVNMANNSLNVNTVLNEILKDPITERNVTLSKDLYNEELEREGNLFCVWSGKRIRKYDIDHIIPFSIWKNNDLWNLLPAQPQINSQKGNKVPSEDLLENQKELILYYWNLLNSSVNEQFIRELNISLIGNSKDNWQDIAFEQLKSNCNYLKTIKGIEEWAI